MNWHNFMITQQKSYYHTFLPQRNQEPDGPMNSIKMRQITSTLVKGEGYLLSGFRIMADGS